MTNWTRRAWMSRAKWMGLAAVAGSGAPLAGERSQTMGKEDAADARSSSPLGPKRSILDCIGNTSLLELRHIVPQNHARVLLKLEGENPTGSMKDRMALAMIEAAEKAGRLKPGGGVVEYTGGSTGVSLSLVCAAKGYPLDIVTSDAFSSEKRNHMAALGATLTTLPSESGGINEALIRSMIEAARQIQDNKGGYWTDQLNNEDQLSGYHAMGNEIWQQTDGTVDVFVQSVGTSGSLRGTAESLSKHSSKIQIVAVEPSESAVLSGGPSGSHKIEGVGAGFVVPLWKPEIVDEIKTTSTADSMAMARRLANEEAVFAGTSTGSNLIAALEKAKELGPGHTVVTLMVDSGMKYLSTELYKMSD